MEIFCLQYQNINFSKFSHKNLMSCNIETRNELVNKIKIIFFYKHNSK